MSFVSVTLAFTQPCTIPSTSLSSADWSVRSVRGGESSVQWTTSQIMDRQTADIALASKSRLVNITMIPKVTRDEWPLLAHVRCSMTTRKGSFDRE